MDNEALASVAAHNALRNPSHAFDVLLAVTTLGPGGTEYYVEQIALGLKARGLRVMVLVDSEPTIRLPELERTGVPVTLLRVDENCPQRRYRELIDRLFQNFSFRLIHANMWTREDWLRQSAIAHGIPVVTTAHSTIPPIRLRDKLGINRIPFDHYRRRRFLQQGLLSTICISDLSLRNFRGRYGVRAKAARVYCGGPGSPKQSHPEAEGNAPTLVWLGSMTDRKRPFLMLHAYERILPSHPNCKLIMVGDGELLPAVQSFISRFAPGLVTVTGYVESIWDALASGQIFVHTSSNEGTPTTVRQAMSAGLPVVATNAGAMAEVVIQDVSGLIVPIDDTDAIARALEILISNPALRAKYGRAGREHFAARFSLEPMIDETINAYRQLTGISFN